LLVSAAHDAPDADHGWLIICASFVASATVPIAHTLRLARRDQLLLRDAGFWPGLFANSLRLRRERRI
jgi:hypothetical protein